MPSNDTNFHTVTGLSVTITPTRADSKILISTTVQANCEDSAMLYMFRDSTLINAGTEGSSGNNNVYKGWIMIRQAVLIRHILIPLNF